MSSSQEKEFYGELDRHKREKSLPKRFTVTKLMILALVILLILEGALFYIGNSLKKSPLPDGTVPLSTNVSSNFSRVDLNDKQYQIVVSEGILCGKIFNNFQRDLSCQISSDGIIVAGKISSVLPSNASIIFIPKVNGGVVDFDVKEATVGSMKIPNFLTYGIKNVFKSVISSEIKGINVSRVDLEPSIMIIIANK